MVDPDQKAGTSPPHQIEMWPIGKLNPYEKNARLHAPDQVTAIAASITRFGFVNPILIDGEAGIIAGHGRLLAAQELGLSEVPVVVLDHLSPEERRAYVLADNRLAELATWDEELLAAELSALREDDFDLSLLGWSEDELTELENGASQPEPLPDAGPEFDRAEELREKWNVEPGQVWTLGRHRIACGDSTGPEVVRALLAGERAHVAITDPPYGIGVAGVTGDDRDEGSLTAFNAAWLPRCLEAIEPPGLLISFHSTRTFPTLLDPARGAGFRFLRMLTLYKRTDRSFPWRGWILVSESILLFQSGDGNPFQPTAQDTDCTLSHDTYLHSDGTEGMEWREEGFERGDSDRSHPTPKPLWVVEDLMAKTSPRDGIVFDPFLGSGTTLIAAERLSRACRGIELEPRYVAVTLERWATMTGQEPRMEDAGQQ